ncbi:hypothetical protein [Vreelandella lionensis]|uniref:hypothetical protein n=1 Tax=Halomonadaceae TaxID=28256 RepID=UPI0009F63ECF|nr:MULTISPECIES: hypothetical protein [Halomonas]MCP1319178.1 hypothetical protein [Halomonas sp. 707B3]
MTDFSDPQSPDEAPVPPSARTAMLAELEGYEHLLFEPMTQADLDGLYALYATWCVRLGESPEAIALCDALDDFIGASIHDEGTGDDAIERAYLHLVATVQRGGE